MTELYRDSSILEVYFIVFIYIDIYFYKFIVYL